MKKISLLISGACIAILGGCAGVPGVPTDLAGAATTVQAAAQASGSVDFKSNEVLCAVGTGQNAVEMTYKVATVLTQASPATKNQAEVLYVDNGKKDWSSYVIPSHKATKAELTVGRLVYHIYGYSNTDAKDVTAQNYRQSAWVLARITSVDELFKNRIEVGGIKYDPGLIRVPDVKLD
jgi:hypothetical protein